MPNKKEKIQIRSEEVQEILSYVPNWMVRYGNTLVLLLILLLLLITWFVKYPDVITAEVVVTTKIPPEKIYAKSTGKIETILVNNRAKVRANSIIAVIENTANYKDVLLLKSIVDTITINKKEFIFSIDELPFLALGDITSNFSNFETNYSEYILNKKLKPYSSEFLANNVSLAEVKNRLAILKSQKELNKKELEFDKKDLNRSKILFEKGVISAQDYERKQLEYTKSKRSFKNMNSSISQLREAIGSSKNTIKSSKIKKTQEDTRLLKKVIQSFYELKRSIKYWELRYALESSIAGEVSYMSFWNKNQTVNAGDLVFTIIPSKNLGYIGKIKAPIQNAGKIKIGQKVNIRLANYPATEFGMLSGKVENISLFPDKDGNYLIDVSLNKKLITSYNKQIDFQQEMRGKAEIITEKLRLIQRFFYQLKNVFDK
ncbi:HlyD family efflux transporter periplasmic adaptor subunit [Lutibacter sp.]|uniref:HlyD family secretion protein n=1 Tax=Lutibacter sp. TaxID=1925666 RepID=UPI0025C615E9|nr:HlyD family efflux transporter periplasmic adaptor subunit [Lutibacter sp.]MCF6181063.1 HlyD family secretion protein [Lutibacter sp.]